MKWFWSIELLTSAFPNFPLGNLAQPTKTYCVVHFEEGHYYHVINRSNEKLFYNDSNYLFFVRKTRKLILPLCNILAWCLMPNHFHFLLQTSERATGYIGEAHRPTTQLLSKNFGTLLSSYTQAINKQYKRRGKLFAHNTKALQITHRGNAYLVNCFHYIHMNPVEAGLAMKPGDWKYSSFRDHAGLRKGSMCSLELVREILETPQPGALIRKAVKTSLIKATMLQDLSK